MEWKPIETFFESAEVDWVSGDTKYYKPVLVVGPTWVSKRYDSPWHPDGGSFSGEVGVYSARTYSTSPCFTADPAVQDYEYWINPTHWMPLPKPPTAS